MWTRIYNDEERHIKQELIEMHIMLLSEKNNFLLGKLEESRNIYD